MQRAPWLKKVLAAGAEFHFTRQVPWKHNLLNVGAAAGLVAAYAAVIAAGAIVPTWLYIPLAPMLLGCVIYGFFVLVIHECSHLMFVLLADRERSKALNHAIGRFTGNLLFTDYMSHWAREHVVHHLQPMEPVDKQDLLRFSDRRLALKYLSLLLPGAALVNNPSRQYGFSLYRTLLGVAVYGSIAVLAVIFIHWHVAVAILYSWNVTAALTMTKVAQEHGSGLETEADPLLRSRTYIYGTQLLTSPFNINYHFEHHANFKVPWYLLRAYHAKVLELMPAPLQPYYVNRGWRQFYGQLAGKQPVPPPELQELLRGELAASA